ncbi:hypothetical protein GOQ27_08440 [Clostridium sp. D2Q-11]|uniref:N-acetyltransferase domain-containing protein n=1 Tax=Anaeromonas frigoriresistens TaxID=2683708 RepID=A0A942Z939_9FIRM|nr:hypothetical protein [Anaeromonas frigoriresistens]MBS4538490.1 hypothetical protein [Anaeromonas frigoriresistens]
MIIKLDVLTLIDSNDFIGEVCFHYDKYTHAHNIGIVIEHKYRCKGYSSEGLNILVQKGFCNKKVNRMSNEIPIERKVAIKGHRNAGFEISKITDDNCILEATRESIMSYKNHG